MVRKFVFAKFAEGLRIQSVEMEDIVHIGFVARMVGIIDFSDCEITLRFLIIRRLRHIAYNPAVVISADVAQTAYALA